MGRRYKCPYCDKREERGKLITHIDRVHKDMLPENYSGARIMYDTINKIIDGHGRCRVCKQPTNWNEKTSRYDALCDNPKCKEHMREEYKKNMLRVRGTYNILNDPEQQQKMLANRSISGTYKYSDGSTFTYTGSYEKKFLEFMDTVLEVPSKDILMPGPTLEYTYKGKKHMYLTDALYLPYNLIIEIKDGGSNLNGKESPGMIASREKTIAKEKLITDKGEYNYIRLTDNNFAQLIEIFMSLKMNALNGDDSKIIRINESYEYDNITKFNAYHLEYKRDGFNKDKPNTWDEELYSKDIDSAIRNDIMGKYDLKDKKSIEAYVYTTTKDLKPIYLGIISIRRFGEEYNSDFDWEWSEQEPLDKNIYDNIMGNPIEESLYDNLPEFDPYIQKPLPIITDIPRFMKDNNLHESVDLNSKGLYHISKSKNITNIKPEVPDNFMTKHGYEDDKTPRVCFTPSINQCLMGLSRNCTDEEFYVYIPDGEYKTHNATIEEVPDSKITGEVWITEPVKVKCVGKIKCTGDSGSKGYEYNYGDKYTAELYDWEWKQIPMNEHNDSLDALRYSYEVLNSVKDPLTENIKSYDGIYNER